MGPISFADQNAAGPMNLSNILYKGPMKNVFGTHDVNKGRDRLTTHQKLTDKNIIFDSGMCDRKVQGCNYSKNNV